MVYRKDMKRGRETTFKICVDSKMNRVCDPKFRNGLFALVCLGNCLVKVLSRTPEKYAK